LSMTFRLSKWSPRRDSNAQPEASDASALVHLSYVDALKLK
jgi:hypothetical protein